VALFLMGRAVKITGESHMESDNHPLAEGEAQGQITPFRRATSGKLLRQAAQRWIRRGYAIVYEDEHLIELAKKNKTPERWAIGLAIAGGALAGLALGGAAFIWLRSRPWRIVSLGASPEQTLVTHAYWSRVRPESSGS
jgi:hypothetical protein